MTPTTTGDRPLRLFGRSRELAVLKTLFTQTAAGRSGTLLLAAPPGLGRTALVDHALARHSGGRVLHTASFPAERSLPYSGLHALLCSGPELLPAPPEEVLRTVTSPAGLLGLLQALTAHRAPLVVCVDDLHSWDAHSRAALVSAAHRLPASCPVALLLTAADVRHGSAALGGLPTLGLGPLDDVAAGALLDALGSGVPGGDRLDPAVRAELVREGVGNPALLAALLGALTADQRTARSPLPHPLPGGDPVLDAYFALVGTLPADTRELLLLAASAEEHEPAGAGTALDLLVRAGRRAGIDIGRLSPAEAAGAARVHAQRVHFTHPLLCRAVRRGTPTVRRRAAHRLLASVLDGPGRSLPRLIQQACAADGDAQELARQLAAAAEEPRPPADRCAALSRAAALTEDLELRDLRLAAAAEQAWLARDAGLARSLLARVRGVPAPPLAHFVQGHLDLRDGPVADAKEALFTAADLLGPQEPERVTDALLGAFHAAWAGGDVTACRQALARIPAPCPEPELDRFRAGLLELFTGRTAAGHALLRRCLENADTADGGRGGTVDRPREGRLVTRAGTASLLRAAGAALVLGDVDAACRIGTRALAAVRAHGPEVLLPGALEHLAYAELRAGRHAQARAHAQQGLGTAHRSGQRNAVAHLHAVLALAASVEADPAACGEHAEAAAALANVHGLHQAATLATWALARSELAAGRTGQAAARLFPLVGPGPSQGHFAARMLAVPCFVEAAVLTGRGEETRPVVEEFADWAANTADPQAPAQLARCRALLAPPQEAADRYAEALALHDRCGGDFERARTQLVYGRWLRRRRRTREARGPLRDALMAFERSDARSWVALARGELRAAGEVVGGHRRSSAPLATLTPQQQRIARCVAEGATNREVALRLSVSPRTVDHHLRNVFATLGVRSRVELARLLDRDEKDAADL
ncbi:LuxR C-terminal-related transcriptional regulator [Streptomyces sp. 549]|uniref:LuxR C-terminal-related transcriptional regulator n=1 Tax=Streptomyces sp. 549 TaxID=3049076 RepID=UPI0024C3033F|nr:LuxR family transcriptional regulator [Streptomyces sp. 549]MDK1474604.1 LuxR C-terminal-related transcriptional regulator [Streptomyces sp. 549]